MTSKMRRLALVLVLASVVALVWVSYAGANRSDDERAVMERVSGIATRLNDLESKDKGMSADVVTMQQSLSSIQADLETIKGEVAALQGATALQKKVDDLASKVNSLSAKMDGLGAKVTSLEQKISLLETRFNEHLRKCYTRTSAC